MRGSSESADRGFTVGEMLAAVVAVGVLATIAIPIHGKYTRHARVSEATSRIGTIITAAKAHAEEHLDASGNPTWPPTEGGVLGTLDRSENFTYSIVRGAGLDATSNALEIQASGIGKMAGVTVLIRVPRIDAGGDPPEVSGL